MLTSQLPTWAQPGCFGQAMTYSDELTECQSCPFAQDCKGEHQMALRRLREAHGIDLEPKRKRFKAPAPTASTTTASGTPAFSLPKKVEDLLARFDRLGLKVIDGFKQRKNPFPADVMFMRIAAHLVLNIPSGVKRDDLIESFMKRMDWSRGTAAAHATQARQALEALGVAEEQNGRLILKR